MRSNDEGPTWHQALAYALVGELLPGLGRQPVPEIQTLIMALEAAGGPGWVRTRVVSRAADGGPWPYAVPDQLMQGLGAAQFAAALRQLRERLDLDSVFQGSRVARAVPRTAGDERLLREVPPHHGHS